MISSVSINSLEFRCILHYYPAFAIEKQLPWLIYSISIYAKADCANDNNGLLLLDTTSLPFSKSQTQSEHFGGFSSVDCKDLSK